MDWLLPLAGWHNMWTAPYLKRHNSRIDPISSWPERALQGLCIPMVRGKGPLINQYSHLHIRTLHTRLPSHLTLVILGTPRSFFNDLFEANQAWMYLNLFWPSGSELDDNLLTVSCLWPVLWSLSYRVGRPKCHIMFSFVFVLGAFSLSMYISKSVLKRTVLCTIHDCVLYHEGPLKSPWDCTLSWQSHKVCYYITVPCILSDSL